MSDFAHEWASNVMHGDKPDKPEVSRETRRANQRARVRSGNARASLPRKWGGCAARTSVNLEELSGAARVTPPTGTTLRIDRLGNQVRRDHMRKIVTEDERLRTRAREDAAARIVSETH